MINKSLESSDTSDWKFALGPTLYCIRSGLIFLHILRRRNEEVISGKRESIQVNSVSTKARLSYGDEEP